MRGPDFVVKRLLFAVATVFVAITLNFVLFRTLSGDAVPAPVQRGPSSPPTTGQRRRPRAPEDLRELDWITHTGFDGPQAWTSGHVPAKVRRFVDFVRGYVAR